MNTIHSQPNRRVLVIDDNRAIHEDFRKILGEPDTSALAARELGGSLTGHSDGPNRGAVFTLELPLRRPKEPS